MTLTGLVDPSWRGRLALPEHYRWPLALALTGFVVYFGAVVVGAELQPTLTDALGVEWSYGWLQQVLGLVAALAFAVAIGGARDLLGLRLPESSWVASALGVGVAIGLLGVAVGYLEDPSALGANQPLEYYLYQATMPGVSEEVGFRGLFLGLLFAWGTRRGWPRGGGWWMIAAHALPFGVLHLLGSIGTGAVLTFGYTYAAAVLLGRLRWTTASVLPCVVAHNVANLTSGVFDVLW